MVEATRPDTIMGVTYISLAPEHPIAVELSQSNSTVYQFVQKCRKLANSEFDTNKIDKQGALLLLMNKPMKPLVQG